ncbi:S8 family serine peptidase [Halorarum salinum]|uniref:S8 family serine peptidase n=1 Tax=Halorarum salinum TaxID=2743089 RepID=A0A7D5QGX7_9EURY|nr:S8 family serine peptidase [Halobaculum salinum]QLG61824.1 S8 family serine peptidase [Halobaculum salinum]
MTRLAPALAVLLTLAGLTTGMVGAAGVPDVGPIGGVVGDVTPPQGVAAGGDARGPVGGSVDGSAAAGTADVGGAGVGDDAVRVGVIGSRFDGDHPELAGRVAAYSRVTPPGVAPASPAAGAHDTAVAEIVADRTDGAELYLVGVGTGPSAEEYERAVDWLLENGVDVVVDSGSYFPATAEGMDRISEAAERATSEDAVFVTSSGNYARRHWRGTPDSGGWLEFDDGTQGNRLGDGAVAGEVTLRLYWDDEADYDLYLYRDLPGRDDPVVAKSIRERGNAEAIDATLPRGHYYVSVYAREAGSEPVDLFAADRRLAHTAADGSAVAPADADGVVSVGAVDGAGSVRPYSSAGADVSVHDDADTSAAGRFDGTSAAAPLVAGTVVSIRERGSYSPAEVEAILVCAADGDARELDPDRAIAVAAGDVADPRTGNATGRECE